MNELVAASAVSLEPSMSLVYGWQEVHGQKWWSHAGRMPLSFKLSPSFVVGDELCTFRENLREGRFPWPALGGILERTIE